MPGQVPGQLLGNTGAANRATATLRPARGCRQGRRGGTRSARARWPGSFSILAQEASMTDITQARVLIVATDGFEQVELTTPLNDLRQAGATVDVASPAQTREP